MTTCQRISAAIVAYDLRRKPIMCFDHQIKKVV